MFKNNNMKKLISSILALAIITASLMVGWVAFGDDLVAINPTTFPDANWRAVVKYAYDKNGDGFLSTDERKVEVLTISGYLEDLLGDDALIEDLTGVEYFTNIKKLYVGALGLKTLDVSLLKNLTQLTCNGNNLTSLRVGSNPNLTTIKCESNELTALNVSGCYSLVTLDCHENKLQNLSVSSNSQLEFLSCYGNELTRLDVTSNSLLKTLLCSKNHLTELDLSYNPKLQNITQNNIGNQTTSATAKFAGSTINIPLSLNRSNVISTSLDTTESGDDGDTSETKTVLGYSATGNFFTKDMCNLKLAGHDGDVVEYEYNVNNANSENMNVFINVDRAFYQVDFYTNDSMTELVSRQFINRGKNAVVPTIVDAPEDKIFGGWSEDCTNITEDKKIYVRWVNEHIWKVTKFVDGEVTIHCFDCGDEYSLDFDSVLNLTEDNVHFVPVLDAIKDGIINAKDYAKIRNDLK